MILLHLCTVCLYPTWSAIYYLRSKLLNHGYNKHAINHSFKHCIVYIMNKLIYYRISVFKVIAYMHQSQRVSLMELDTPLFCWMTIYLYLVFHPLCSSVCYDYLKIFLELRLEHETFITHKTFSECKFWKFYNYPSRQSWHQQEHVGWDFWWYPQQIMFRSYKYFILTSKKETVEIYLFNCFIHKWVWKM